MIRLSTQRHVALAVHEVVDKQCLAIVGEGVHRILEREERTRNVADAARAAVPRIVALASVRRIAIEETLAVVGDRPDDDVVEQPLAHVLHARTASRRAHLRAPEAHAACGTRLAVAVEGQPEVGAKRLAVRVCTHAAGDVFLAVDGVCEDSVGCRGKRFVVQSVAEGGHRGVEVGGAHGVSRRLGHFLRRTFSLMVRGVPVRVASDGLVLVTDEVLCKTGVLVSPTRPVSRVDGVRKAAERVFEAGVPVQPCTLRRGAKHGIEMIRAPDCRIEKAAVLSLRHAEMRHAQLDEVAHHVEFVIGGVGEMRQLAQRVERVDVSARLLRGKEHGNPLLELGT